MLIEAVIVIWVTQGSTSTFVVSITCLSDATGCAVVSRQVNSQCRMFLGCVDH